ncbi:MAG: cation ABC transporter substrate-binding protein [Denitrovibrio sp.]|nr:MAG: cation ABC transporter substrate-binding protein [Denitrovibrio sp.]
MRLILLLITLSILISSTSYAKVNVYVSIIPQKFFVQAIGKERVNINVMVMPGASPATYEPRPKQMIDLSKTDIYFAIGSPFEKSWVPKFESINNNIKVIHTDKGIVKRIVERHVHHEEDEHIHEGETTTTKDPHIWLDPMLVIHQMQHVANALCEADADGCNYYNSNLSKFTKDTIALDRKIKEIVSKSDGKYFMVFHPSWGYFADRYGLHQIPVELEGKEPKPADLKEFVELTRKLKLKAIFIQPQFSKKAAELIAKETGANVVAVDPLAENWRANLLYVAKLISTSF